MKQIVKLSVKFPENHFWDSTFVFVLGKSPAFEYGNGTCVMVERTFNHDGSKSESKMIDTRYKQGITKNFLDWCKEYLKQNFTTHEATVESFPSVKILVKPEDLWDYCLKNTQRLADAMDITATTGDDENDLWLYVTRDFTNEDDERCFMLSLECAECIIDSETFSSTESAAEHMRAFIKQMEEMYEEQKSCH